MFFSNYNYTKLESLQEHVEIPHIMYIFGIYLEGLDTWDKK